METYVTPQNKPPPALLNAPLRQRPSHSQFSTHAAVLLGSSHIATHVGNQETQTRPIVPARSPTSPPVVSSSPYRSDQPFINGASRVRATVPQTHSVLSGDVHRHISLVHGRHGLREQNDYVGSPTIKAASEAALRQSSQHSSAPERDEPHLHRIHKMVSLPPRKPSTKNLLSSPSATQRLQTTTSTTTANASLKKNAKETHGASDSILCHRCNRCKCAQCMEPRELPSTWICKKRILVSADSIVECCTCLLCVKFVFYHCGGDCVSDSDDNNSYVDDLCACCSRPHVIKRWVCMLLMSLCLPCLCCYWPARGCVAMCKSCYNKSTRRGCRCKTKEPPNRRLLLESDSSST